MAQKETPRRKRRRPPDAFASCTPSSSAGSGQCRQASQLGECSCGKPRQPSREPSTTVAWRWSLVNERTISGENAQPHRQFCRSWRSWDHRVSLESKARSLTRHRSAALAKSTTRVGSSKCLHSVAVIRSNEPVKTDFLTSSPPLPPSSRGGPESPVLRGRRSPPLRTPRPPSLLQERRRTQRCARRRETTPGDSTPRKIRAYPRVLNWGSIDCLNGRKQILAAEPLCERRRMKRKGKGKGKRRRRIDMREKRRGRRRRSVQPSYRQKAS